MHLLVEDSGRKTVVLEKTRDSLAEFGQIQSYAFKWRMAPPVAQEDEERVARSIADPTPFIATYSRDDEMVAVLSILQESVYLKSRSIAHGGIGGVASLPWARRQGNVGMTLVGACRHMRDLGVCVSALYPFSYAFYRRYGWELGQRCVYYKIPMAELRPFAKSPGHIERIYLGPEEAPGSGFERISSLYTSSAQTRAASFVRSPGWWRRSPLGGIDSTKFVCMYVSPSGDDEGYITYSLSRDANELQAHELIYTTPRALNGLLGYAFSHDSMVNHFTWEAPWGTDLLALLDNPRVEATVRTKMMFRVVDVLPTLQHLAADYDGPSVTFEVSDDHLEWNRGIFRVSSGLAERLTDEGSAIATVCEPDVRCSVQRLSQLVCAYASARDLAAAGLIEARHTEALAAIDKLCITGPSYVPFMNDYF